MHICTPPKLFVIISYESKNGRAVDARDLDTKLLARHPDVFDRIEARDIPALVVILEGRNAAYLRTSPSFRRRSERILKAHTNREHKL
jgi:hypothetical protein